MPTIQDTARSLLPLAAGMVGARTVAMGLDHGLIEQLSAHPGRRPEELAEATGLDPFYTEVWAQAAVASGFVDRADDGRLTLVDHADSLLLDEEHPAYIGGVFDVLRRPEILDSFERSLPNGRRTWWDRLDPSFIEAVARAGLPSYNRLVPDGLSRIPGVIETLESGGDVLEMACGTGPGLQKLVERFPAASVTGLDGDRHSLERARHRLAEHGHDDRVELVHSAFEDLDATEAFDVVIISNSMHESRDIERVTAAIKRALRPGGVFVNSDFPFPDTVEGLRTPPGQIMAGIQFFEAQIDDQLVPVDTYLDLLKRHGFTEVGVVELTPVHAVTHGRA